MSSIARTAARELKLEAERLEKLLREFAAHGAPFDQLARAEAAEAARHLLHRSYELRDESDLWPERTVTLDRALTDYAFPAGLPHMSLESARPGAIDMAINFLWDDPYCFGSGYTKEKLLSLLRHPQL